MTASPRYLELLERMKALHVGKSAGYSGEDNPDTWANFREARNWGITDLDGCLVRLGDKYKRLQNLHLNPANDQVGEAFPETAMDLAAYALIAICLHEEQDEALKHPPEPIVEGTTIVGGALYDTGHQPSEYPVEP